MTCNILTCVEENIFVRRGRYLSWTKKLICHNRLLSKKLLKATDYRDCHLHRLFPDYKCHAVDPNVNGGDKQSVSGKSLDSGENYVIK